MDSLYFLAIIPPEEISKEIVGLKEYISEKYKSKAALKSPPHITLHMPFRWKEHDEERLVEELIRFSTGKKSFPVTLHNYNAFPPKVIFIDVVPSDPLNNLQKEAAGFFRKELKLFNANYKDRAFHPHVTIAFRDLKKPSFSVAFEEFKNKKFLASFVADGFYLLKHNGKIWEALRKFSLGK